MSSVYVTEMRNNGKRLLLWLVRLLGSSPILTSKINSFMTEAVIDWFLYDNGLRHERVKQI